jgi:hypothetical protein
MNILRTTNKQQLHVEVSCILEFPPNTQPATSATTKFPEQNVQLLPTRH